MKTLSTDQPGSPSLRPRQFSLGTLLLVQAVFAVYFALARDRETQPWILPVFATVLGMIGGLLFGRRGRSVFWGTVCFAGLTGLLMGAINVAIAVYMDKNSAFAQTDWDLVAASPFVAAIYGVLLGTLPGWVLTSLAYHDGKIFWFNEHSRQEPTASRSEETASDLEP